MTAAHHQAERRAEPQGLWAAPFRPFYLLGALYAPLLAATGAWGWLGGSFGPAAALAPPLWHEHEMLYGFALGIAGATLMTALPSWADTPETQGPLLAALVACWLAGRAGFWLAPWLPLPLVAALDLLLPVAVAALLVPQVWRVRQRLYRLLLPVLVALPAALACFHWAWAQGDAVLAARALRGAVWALLLLFALKGGVLTPVFTGNALREQGEDDDLRTSWPLEVAAIGLLFVLAGLDLAGAPQPWTAAVAAAATVANGLRLVRWRGWRVRRAALVPGMHLGFFWLTAALALKTAHGLGAPVPESAWVHAFTVGALGMMMMSLMTRVALRHTGRALAVPAGLRWVGPAMFAAAALRLAAAVHGLGPVVVCAAVAVWAACFVGYLRVFGSLLVAPSLPRE